MMNNIHQVVFLFVTFWGSFIIKTHSWTNIKSTSYSSRSWLQASVGKVAVCGANGKTGKKVVQLLLNKKQSVQAITRSGLFSEGGSGSKLLTVVAGDVSNSESIRAALKGVDACIFTASASKEGGKLQLHFFRLFTYFMKL